MTATLLQMPDLHKKILETLWNSFPKPIRLDEMLNRTGIWNLALWQKTLVDLEEQEFVEQAYDVGENRCYFYLTRDGRMHLLGLVLCGKSDAVPVAITQADGFGDDGDVSTHLLQFADAGPAHNGAADVPYAVGNGASASSNPLAEAPKYLTAAEIVDKVSGGPTIQDRAQLLKDSLAEFDRFLAPDPRYRADDSELEKFRGKL